MLKVQQRTRSLHEACSLVEKTNNEQLMKYKYTVAEAVVSALKENRGGKRVERHRGGVYFKQGIQGRFY